MAWKNWVYKNPDQLDWLENILKYRYLTLSQIHTKIQINLSYFIFENGKISSAMFAV
jgi:hypothetical protein